ncbi:hypothetical protein [Azospirillum halopraeferens]|uniref:hypothetical protein n=1 Tax=Azospirillum halopraeferens TaxID=34010 RepID=UPI00041CD86F|nr:hypothetical protein [Azospirillum halopraeferens]
MAIEPMTIDAAVRVPAPRPAESAFVLDGTAENEYRREGTMSFSDFLDVINPLQHIPVVGQLYRGLTGDTITPAARVMGGILFGGPLGGAAAVTNVVVEQASGRDIGDHMMAAVGMGGTAAAVPAANPEAPAAQGGAGATNWAAAPLSAPVAAQMAAAQPAAAPAAVQAAAAQPAAPAGAETAAPKAAGAEKPPGRMPPRDTVLANTLQAKHAARGNPPPAPAVPAAMAAVPVSPVPQGDAPPAATGGQPAPVAPELLSEVMMRNLAKYEAARKAAERQAPKPPGVRVSG